MTLPVQSRVLVPVLGATGGSGRSTAAGLLARSFAAAGSSVVLDTASRLSSPWPSWPNQSGTGLVSLPPDRPFTREQAQAAASTFPAEDGRTWSVLTDHLEWHQGQLALPEVPAAWYQLAAGGGWQAVLADTTHLVAHDIVTARAGGRDGLTAAWCSLPFSVPVLCALATGSGVAALQMAIKAASAEGLPLQRTVVVLSSPGEGRIPAAVRAAATMLQSLVASVVIVPFDSHIRTHGLADPDRLGRRTKEAGDTAAAAVLAAAHRTWGDPLPSAPTPAALAASSTDPAQSVPEGGLTT